MEMTGEQLISAQKSAVWEGLNDPGILKTCISGCELLEKLSDTEFVIVTISEIEPVKAKFRGKRLLTGLDPLNSYSLLFDDQGGAAGFGKGSAKVSLQDESGGTRLACVANIQVRGKLAQIGSRLIGGVANRVAAPTSSLHCSACRARPHCGPRCSCGHSTIRFRCRRSCVRCLKHPHAFSGCVTARVRWPRGSTPT